MREDSAILSVLGEAQKNIFPPNKKPNEEAFQSLFRPPVPVVCPSLRL